MKEISIEEKAARYDEAINRIKHYVVDKYGCSRIKVADIFPELKESDDERIRKELIAEVKEQIDCIPAPDCRDEEDEKALKQLNKWLAWLEKQGEPQDKGEISDGYHTFNELYYYRMLYNAAFFNMLPKEWVHKSKKHHDGEDCFGGGWFIVMANLPTGQISNHYELKDWDLFQIPEKEVADKWDGHTPQEAANRLHKYLLEKQGEQWKPNDEMLEALYRAIPENVMEISEDAILLGKLYQGLKYGRVLSKK